MALLAALLVLLGSGHAAAMEPDARTLADARPCLDAMGIGFPLEEDRTTTCVVTYLHLNETGSGAFDPLWPETGGQAEAALSPQGTQFRLPPSLVTYGYDGTLFFDSPTPPYPVHFEAETPLHLQLHLKADDRTVPVCLRLDLRIDREDPSGERQTLSEAHVMGSMGTSTASVDTPCPEGERIPTSMDGTATLDVTFPPLSDLEIDPTERLYLNITARAQGLSDPLIRPSGFRIVHTASLPNHITLPIHDALSIIRADTDWYTFQGLMFHMQVTSPLGMNDVTGGPTAFRVVDDNGTPLDSEEMGQRGGPGGATGSCSRCPGTTLSIWEVGPSTIPDGDYTAEITAWNTQRTARETVTIPLTLGANGTLLTVHLPDGAAQSYELREQSFDCDCVGPGDHPRRTLQEALPAPPLPLALILLAALLTTARRRRLL